MLFLFVFVRIAFEIELQLAGIMARFADSVNAVPTGMFYDRTSLPHRADDITGDIAVYVANRNGAEQPINTVVHVRCYFPQAQPFGSSLSKNMQNLAVVIHSP